MSAPLINPLQSYTIGVASSVKLLLVSTVWASSLIPLLGVLLFLSTPGIRRQPIFIMNVFTVTMGIVLGIVNIKLNITLISNSFSNPMTTTAIAYIGMIVIMPIIMDCILAYRLTAVYPRLRTSIPRLGAIFIPIVIFKVARLTNVAAFLVAFTRDTQRNFMDPCTIHKD
ncbi:hypothetical protein L218DRAFT_975916 [Marasmius fiardii PR-910]|nr:hypothetical protein L218DRAFT_975916 [Marasmius fiardii PR-910]